MFGLEGGAGGSGMPGPSPICGRDRCNAQPTFSEVTEDGVLTAGSTNPDTRAPNRADQALAQSVRLWATGRRFQHPQTESRNGPVQPFGEDRIAIVQEETESVIGSERLSQLLQRPIGRRVLRDIEVQQFFGSCDASPQRRRSGGRSR